MSWWGFKTVFFHLLCWPSRRLIVRGLIFLLWLYIDGAKFELLPDVDWWYCSNTLIWLWYKAGICKDNVRVASSNSFSGSNAIAAKLRNQILNSSSFWNLVRNSKLVNFRKRPNSKTEPFDSNSQVILFYVLYRICFS